MNKLLLIAEKLHSATAENLSKLDKDELLSGLSGTRKR